MRQVPVTHWYTSGTLHDISSLQAVICRLTIMTLSNLTSFSLHYTPIQYMHITQITSTKYVHILTVTIHISTAQDQDDILTISLLSTKKEKLTGLTVTYFTLSFITCPWQCLEKSHMHTHTHKCVRKHRIVVRNYFI